MRITLGLSFLCILDASWGFAPGYTQNQGNADLFRRRCKLVTNHNRFIENTSVSEKSVVSHGQHRHQFTEDDASSSSTAAAAAAAAAAADLGAPKRSKRSSTAASSQAVSSSDISSQSISDGKNKLVRIKSNIAPITPSPKRRKNDKHALQWTIRLEQLMEYKQQHGDCLVPYLFPENPQLGHWVSGQRQAYKSVPKRISEECIEMLDEIGFVWDLLESQWESNFRELVTYQHQHGDCLVPNLYQGDPQLGVWVQTQRVCYNRLPQAISDERIQRLNGIGFEWDALKPQWEMRFQELVEYKQQHGDCLVPSFFRHEENQQLATWVHQQRKCYNRFPKTISDECIQRLNDLGFEWDHLEAQWDLHLKEFAHYKQQHGDCVELLEKYYLGAWVQHQCAHYNHSPKTISDKRIQRLNNIGFEWDALKAKWKSRFQELVEYKQQHGDCHVPSGYKENTQLGWWVRQQRKHYNHLPRMISDDCIQRLDDIGFEWDLNQAQWDSYFKELVEYKQQNGELLAPDNKSHENPQLGLWMQQQRNCYKCSPKQISDERIQRLDAVGFEWDAHKAQWESRFRELLEFKRRHHHCLVPKRCQEFPTLVGWVWRQRKLYKAVPTMISDERMQRLNDIGFSWVGRYMQWEEGFDDLLKYKQVNGDCMVPKPFPDNQLLGRWVDDQRQRYDKEPKLITKKRIQRLESIGFVWYPICSMGETI